MISIVIPIYNEEQIVENLDRAIHDALIPTKLPWQVYYINDGSSDQTLPILLRLQQANPATVTVVDLSRNWGHQAAITAGLSLAQGDAIVLMDGDFQDPPSLIPTMIERWKTGAEIVIARRRSRGESGLRKHLFTAFYHLLGFLSDYPIPLQAGIFSLMDRRACDTIRGLQETNRFLPGLRSWVGFRTAFIEFDRLDRASGEPKQTFIRLLKYGMDAIFGFSYKPLRVSLAMGILIAALAFIAAFVLVIMRIARVGIFEGEFVLGFTSIICTVVLLCGVQLICTGILGEYIGRIYDEVKRRPLFVIREVHNKRAA
jgi:glycosyltransferase involved in cell wall biosynthesis